ncbi:MAG: exodeoxyribonuclease VII small subunit [Phycisphaeraceae bacterium]|nr:exodeoxyribonuclease VII small subunit [Phycisphaeraceae bacterium]MBX3368336.1 exodeoxyribonuclease VII small subunit [Phycisphaeraceae bacterium]QYK48878.1 MAG: exodeoxyribonuclease VII small subunit [Phycisphaeraceae bacterium]
MAKRRTNEERESPTFERALEELESIIARVESGEIGLEESIGEYERGVGLIRRCREILSRAEQRIQQLSLSDIESGQASSPDEDSDDEGGDEESSF